MKLSIMIESQKGPEVVITPGISSAEYLKRQQELENIFLQLDGTKIYLILDS